MTDVSELADTVGRVARSSSGYTTNFFASPADTERWVASRTLSVLHAEQAVLILHRNANFHRLYHVASSTPALSASLGVLCATASMPTTTIVTDLVGRQENLHPVLNAHLENEFTVYTRLLRMHRSMEPLKNDWCIDPGVAHAEPDDTPHIHLFMNRQLDPLSEQIPDPAQLNDAVAKRAVLVVRQASDLAGVLIYDTVGFTTTLRYWHVNEQFRDCGVGARLIKTFFRLCGDSRRILLWVIANNNNAISRYRHYGFQDDSLVDDILVRKIGSAQR